MSIPSKSSTRVGDSVFTVSIDRLEGAQVLSDGWQAAIAEGEVHDVVVRVQVDPVYLERHSSVLSFTVASTEERLSATEPARFLGTADAMNMGRESAAIAASWYRGPFVWLLVGVPASAVVLAPS